MGASVVLVDHSPGERRIVDLANLHTSKGIIVCHDTEEQPTLAAYGWERVWHLFKYRSTLKSPMVNGYNSAWATIVSNNYDVTAFKGRVFNQYIVA
jgi:hypothetical protein